MPWLMRGASSIWDHFRLRKRCHTCGFHEKECCADSAVQNSHDSYVPSYAHQLNKSLASSVGQIIEDRKVSDQ